LPARTGLFRVEGLHTFHLVVVVSSYRSAGAARQCWGSFFSLCVLITREHRSTQTAAAHVYTACSSILHVNCRLPRVVALKNFVLSDVSLSHSLSRCVCVERGRMHLFRELGAWVRTNSASDTMCIVTTACCTPWLLILKQ
jgi:hypothetical protein